MSYDGITVPYRNAKCGVEDCSIIVAEINHPLHGWIETSVKGNDAEENLRQLFERITTNGDAAAYTPPDPLAAPVPDVISRRQFWTALYFNGTITAGEFEGVWKGFLPLALQAIVASLPSEPERIVATGMLLGAQEFQRGHSLVHVFQTANGWNSEQVDAFFKAAYAL